jgi:2-amino-4-hydroxy-6-hydroxymethyldihydropteridine diphosphokinase
MSTRVFIALGSNLEDSIGHVTTAMTELEALAEPDSFSASSLYRSKPLANMEQPDYINAVVCFRTSLTAYALLAQCQALENAHGRQRGIEKWSSRTLDLDIILYGNEVFTDEHLTIPHPGMKERSFVLYPIAELDPALKLPDNTTLQHCLMQCPAEGLITIEPE